MVLFEYIILSYFSFVVFYNLILSIAGVIRNPSHKSGPSNFNRFLVLIPAYKEDGVIVDSGLNALKQNYPSEYFEVVVIADSLKPETLSQLKSNNITYIEVSFEQSTKVKSLNAALNKLPDYYDICLILDADNVMESDFLAKINAKYNEGQNVIQGRRVAKNLTTSFAILDAISEMVNNHIQRKGTCALSLSSSLIGSGMAFNHSLLKSTLLEMNSIGGFDRELELRLIAKGHKAYYLENAEVKDEKVEKSEVFSNQRKRWISSQAHYLKKYFFKGFKSLFKGDIVYFNSAILRNIQLPRVLNLGLLFFIAIFAVVFNSLFTFPMVWVAYFLMFLFSILLAIPIRFYNKRFFSALIELPRAFFIMFLLLFRLKGANKKFIHTPHGNNPT